MLFKIFFLFFFIFFVSFQSHADEFLRVVCRALKVEKALDRQLFELSSFCRKIEFFNKNLLYYEHHVRIGCINVVNLYRELGKYLLKDEWFETEWLLERLIKNGAISRERQDFLLRLRENLCSKIARYQDLFWRSRTQLYLISNHCFSA